ncbi:MAG: hypothetical protein ACR2QC_02130 [Gammaproteobacteria bacterium]
MIWKTAVSLLAILVVCGCALQKQPVDEFVPSSAKFQPLSQGQKMLTCRSQVDDGRALRCHGGIVEGQVHMSELVSTGWELQQIQKVPIDEALDVWYNYTFYFIRN